MPTPTADIATARLILRLLGSETINACMAGYLAQAGSLLGAAVPAELLSHPSSLQYNQQQLDADPLYLPWSARAIILPGEKEMAGLIRFHSRPNPAYLRPFVQDAVELGY